ncbi:hypothetical protein F4777DRAFT_91133 [Nemania sp. FL0916]|nr:hypothetical protein F4777DRAFT_91133 [Nemania sp. FL0916]
MASDAALSAEAKALVESITRSHGYLGEDVLRLMPADIRRTVEASLINEARVGNTVKALVKNLERGSGHFVFELLRNADDNQFTNAAMLGEDPYVTFKISPSCITVECNEDGFTPENLTSLCAIGRSSKVDSPGYFGQEGIGFKSVFTVAHKVHIQSGRYSFSFNHRSGQSGMGMISPTWEDPEQSLHQATTRIRLHLHPELANTTDPPYIHRLEDIRATHLLFLRNIRRINIVHVTDDDVVLQFRKLSIRQNMANFMTVTDNENSVASKSSNYYIHKYLVLDLPRDKKMMCPQIRTTAQESLSPSEIVLAFPVNETQSDPVLSNQEIFSFLPLANMGFKFLIQADFVTQASCHEIDTSSGRNGALLHWVAVAFIRAIRELGKTKDFRFKWMRYLPQKGDHSRDGYWKELYNNIKAKIEETPLIFNSAERYLYSTTQMKRLTPLAADDKGCPIFEDASPAMYISESYEGSDLNLLTDYGLEWMTFRDILTRASSDLGRLNSRMKSTTQSDEWHTAAARCLAYPFENTLVPGSNYVRTLELIPLENGTWISATSASTPLSFASTGGVAIPKDLPLTFINSSATKNDARATLFRHLGAEEPSISRIRELIFNKYPANSDGTLSFDELNISEDESLAHLEFLYLTHHGTSADVENYKRVAIFTESKTWRVPFSEDVYFLTTRRYGVKSLLEPSTDSEPPNVEFLSYRYVLRRKEPAWSYWLQANLGIRIQPRFIDNNRPTAILRYVMDHRKTELLGVLWNYWPEIGNDVEGCKSIREEIGNCFVPCTNGLTKLNQSYLPLPNLLASCSQFLGDTTFFPFLNLSATPAPTQFRSWGFLSENFGVEDSLNVLFYQDVLVGIAERDHEGEYGQDIPMKTFELYEVMSKQIGTKIQGTEDQMDYIRSMFRASGWPLILLPIIGAAGDRWKNVDDCRWDCPANMKSLSGLRSHYASIFTEAVLSGTIMPFMRDVGVKDLSSKDIIDELRLQRGREDEGPDKDLIRELYSWLADLLSNSAESHRESVRETFKNEALIFAEGEEGDWHETQGCIWSSKTYMLSKIDLSSHYPDMESVFITGLGVSTLTLEIAYEELRIKGAIGSTVDEMKAELWQFNSLLSTTYNKPDPGPILASQVFPVKCPKESVQLMSAAGSDFVVVDRKPLEEKFRGLVKILDFSLNEVHRLHPFLQWAGLEDRRLSVRVTEVITGVTIATTEAETRQKFRRSVESKAYALCRIARHLRSPRAENPEALYRTLKRVEMVETSSIRAELRLIEDGHALKVTQAEANLHIDSKGDIMKVYVPNDRSCRAKGLLYDLPQAFYNWIIEEKTPKIATVESEVIKRLIATILVAKHSFVDALLDAEGIVGLDFTEDSHASDGHIVSEKQGQIPSTPIIVLDEDENEDEDGIIVLESPTPAASPGSSSVHEPRNNDENLSPGPRSGSSKPSTSSPGSSVSVSLQTIVPSPSSPASSPESDPPLGSKSGEKAVVLEEPTYVLLLDYVIRAGRVAGIPSKMFDMSDLKRSLPRQAENENPADYFNHSSSKGDDRKSMMGAAGELYVFELLSHLDPSLPDFTPDIWHSTVRHWVAAHPQYEDLQPWTGMEIADMVYTDSKGVLTEALIENGYLERERWGGHKPRYYIEVKATPWECSAQFFLSRWQYNRMSKMTEENLYEGHEAIYVIFRVYYLGTSSVSCQLYPNPTRLIDKGILSFEPPTDRSWVVRAKPHYNML